MPPRRSTRTSNKKDEDTDKKDDEYESEEENKKPAKGKGKAAAKGKDSAKDKSPTKKDDVDDKGTRKSARAKASDKKKDDDDDDDEKIKDEKKSSAKDKRKADVSPPKTKAKEPAKKQKSKDDSDDDKKDDAKIVKKIVKGGVAVDEHFDEKNCHVYVTPNKAYAVMLNQSNLAKNNNKFYVIQLLESDNQKGVYWTWNRWGRVGSTGQTSKKEFDDVQDAIRDYEAKLRDKTVKGDYTIVDINYDDDEEEEEEEKKKDDKKDDKKEEVKMVKKIVKGGVAVDEKFDEKDCHVYVTPNKVYAAMLNQSNLAQNNNKFYVIQLIESESQKGVYWTWNRWGRVGKDGQTMKKRFTNVQDAISDYEGKLRDKTVKGDYIIVDIKYDNEDEAEEEKADEKDDGDDEKKSKLPGATKELIKLIFDLKMMNEQMKEIGYDAKKMPLGKLSKDAIQKGYGILKDINEEVKKAKPNRATLIDLSSEFYSNIPHDFGFDKMINQLLDTEEKVKKKLEMLQSIEDIQVATRILGDKSKNKDESVIDQNYKKLNADIHPVDKKSDEYKIIEEYITNTHATTHNQYGLEILDAFEVDRAGEDARFKANIGNRTLLWHGSRLTNFVGILSQGLRIAPPEAPVTGYMFGKGVYFADMVSKSANYCFTSPANPVGILLLCDVALGTPQNRYFADYYASNLDAGTQSTKGCGRTAPKESDSKMIGDIKVPCGKGVPTNIPQGTLLYNEFIVYDIAQIKIKYLLKVKFNYRR